MDQTPVLYGGRRNAAEMEVLLGQMERSPLTQKAFAASHGTSVAVLHYWKRRLRRTERPHFVEVEPVAMPTGGSIRIELPGKITVHLDGPLPVEALVQLSRALL